VLVRVNNFVSFRDMNAEKFSKKKKIRKTSNMKVVDDDQIYVLTKGILISWNEHELIENSLRQI
jgi:hypothetical protein